MIILKNFTILVIFDVYLQFASYGQHSGALIHIAKEHIVSVKLDQPVRPAANILPKQNQSMLNRVTNGRQQEY